MKKLKISMLALAVVAGGAMCASAAAKATEGDTFEANIKFASNAPLSFIDVSAAPQGALALTISNSFFNGVVDTDGSGKIEGAGFERILNGPFVVVVSNNPPQLVPTAFSDYNVSVSGKISTKNNLPNVQETLKGTGYSSTTNIFLTGPGGGSVIIIKSPSSGSSSFSVTYTGNAATAHLTNNNVVGDFQAGRLKGSIKPGISAINGGKSIKVDEAALLDTRLSTVTDLPLQVVKFGNKFWANTIGPNFNGSGSVSSSKVTANFKGLGRERGSSFKLTGTGGTVTIITGGATNTVSFVTSVDVSGKINGQTVSAKGASVVQYP